MERNRWTRATSGIWVALAAVLAFSGCATTSHKVSVNGYATPQAETVISPGQSVAVVKNEDAENPLLEKEIAEKTEALLSEKGYPPVPMESADVLVFFSYGSETAPPAGSSGPGISVGMGGGSGGIFSGGSVYFPGGGGRSEGAARYRLALQAIDASPYRESETRDVLWAGEAESSADDTSMRDIVDYLLLAVMDHFGEDTGETVEVKIDAEDPGIQSLRSQP